MLGMHSSHQATSSTQRKHWFKTSSTISPTVQDPDQQTPLHYGRYYCATSLHASYQLSIGSLVPILSPHPNHLGGGKREPGNETVRKVVPVTSGSAVVVNDRVLPQLLCSFMLYEHNYSYISPQWLLYTLVSANTVRVHVYCLLYERSWW